MNHMTEYLKNQILDEKLHNAYVSLHNEDGEIVKTSYARQPVVFTQAERGQTSNTDDILFPIAQEDWGPITKIGINDSENDGNLLWIAPAEYVKSINISSQYKIPTNYLIVRLR